MKISSMIPETQEALQTLTAHTFCRTDKERAKYILGAKLPEYSKLPPIVMDNISAIATGSKTL